MFNMRSAWDTAHVNSVCTFACLLPLWPERVVACRVSLSSGSSGCVKLLLVESGLRLILCNDFTGLCNDFTGLCKISSRIRSTVSSDVFGHPGPISPAQITFLLDFFVPCPHLHCCWRLLWELDLKCMLNSLVRLWSSILQHTKRFFSSSEGHLHVCNDKNTKHYILT